MIFEGGAAYFGGLPTNIGAVFDEPQIVGSMHAWLIAAPAKALT
jgi:hypothetical protein